jgi:hypothetical protein
MKAALILTFPIIMTSLRFQAQSKAPVQAPITHSTATHKK